MALTETKNRRGPVATILGYADSLAARASDTVLIIGRLAMGIIFFQSGLAKLGACRTDRKRGAAMLSRPAFPPYARPI